MNVFDILGPVMIGPSSSHTAGAARIGGVARAVLAAEPVKAVIQLHGSFAKTYKGHGTDKAIIAGIMGMAPDDERIRRAPELAEAAGLAVSIETVELDGALGKARVEREGKDVTIVSYSIGMKNARGAADLLAKEGIEAEVIDLITLSPWDKETVLNSVKKTHRLCIVHEAVKQGGFGAEISATVAEEAMEYLDAPILRYGAPFCPIPFAPTLEKMVKVVPEDLVKGIKGMF